MAASFEMVSTKIGCFKKFWLYSQNNFTQLILYILSWQNTEN